MALLAAWLALEDAGRPDLSGERVGLVVATGYGASRSTFAFLDSVIDDGDACASPTLFSNSVHNAAGGYLSIVLKADGPALTVSQFEMSVPAALLSAGLWLAEGRVDRVLFGGVDEYCDVLGYCWQRFYGEQAGGPMRPLEFDRQTAVVGEGAAFFLLTHEERIVPRYGFITNVEIGGSAQVHLPDDAILILGADGHRKCCSRYAQYLSADRTFACYTPLYGSLPVGQAFDMAIAALSRRDNRIFAPLDYSANGKEALERVVGGDQTLGSKEICCLKLGGAGEFAIVTLARD
jgi:3-oxoacyl-[acyl-carrier-protein] synthase II